MSGTPKTTPQIWRFTGKALRTQDMVVLMAVIYYSERIQRRTGKGEGIWGEVWRKPDTSSTSPLPVDRGLHRMHLILPAMSYNTGGMSTRNTCLSLGFQHFYLRLIIEVHSTVCDYSHWKFQIPRRKAGCQHKKHCTNSIGTVHHCYL